jgi:hypothetical protein
MDPAVFSTTSKDVIIDSRDRDAKLFPSPSQYEISLHEDLQDVLALELITADVPMSSYIVNSGNCGMPTLTMFDSVPTSTSAVNMPTGDYTPAELALEVQAVLNSSSIAPPSAPSTPFRVSYVSRTDNYMIQCKRTFALTFSDNNKHNSNATSNATIARLLGFVPGSRVSSALDAAADPLYPHVIASPHRRDFDVDRFCILRVEPAYVNINPVNPALDKSFAVIPGSSTRRNVGAAINEPQRKVFKPPLAKFSKLRISFVDGSGKPYDFHNRDHLLQFRFQLIRQKKYTQQQSSISNIPFGQQFEGIPSEL